PARRVTRLEVDPADHRLDETAAFAGEAQEKLRLGLARSRLHQDRARNLRGGEMRLQVLDAEVPIDRRECRRKPAVIAARQAPEMLVRVDPHQTAPIGSGTSGARSFAS